VVVERLGEEVIRVAATANSPDHYDGNASADTGRSPSPVAPIAAERGPTHDSAVPSGTLSAFVRTIPRSGSPLRWLRSTVGQLGNARYAWSGIAACWF
jgi:hypothetical protein